MPEFHQRSVTLLTTLGPGIRAVGRHPILASGRQRSGDVWGCRSRPRRCRKLGYVAAVGVLPDAAVERRSPPRSSERRRSRCRRGARTAPTSRTYRNAMRPAPSRSRAARGRSWDSPGRPRSPRSGREYRRPLRPGWWRMIPSIRMRCAPQPESPSVHSRGWCRSNRDARMRCNWFRWRRRSMRPRRPCVSPSSPNDSPVPIIQSPQANGLAMPASVVPVHTI